jgi:glucosyl-3-phosphoglycerate synthase
MSRAAAGITHSQNPFETTHMNESPVLDQDLYTLERALAAKGATTIAVCLPARNEETTVGVICEAIRTNLMIPGAQLVDELVVVDDRSSDRTASTAASAGARVVPVDTVLPEVGAGSGKGNALWNSIAATSSDIIIWCDADLRSFEPSYIVRLAGPLLEDDSFALVKGYYDRVIDGQPGTGGRTTELMARPTLSLLYPGLSSVRQPLGGEYSVRREVVEQLSMVQGYGVEIALLIDVDEHHGIGSIAQIDLGIRVHRNRPLPELSVQSAEILHTALIRAGIAFQQGWSRVLVRPDHEPVEIDVRERPPLTEVPGYEQPLVEPQLEQA